VCVASIAVRHSALTVAMKSSVIDSNEWGNHVTATERERARHCSLFNKHALLSKVTNHHSLFVESEDACVCLSIHPLMKLYIINIQNHLLSWSQLYKFQHMLQITSRVLHSKMHKS
jgi:hypothetical protein